MYSTYLAVHLFAVMVWIGSISAAGLMLAVEFATPEQRGQLALASYRRLSVPAFLLALCFGVVCFVTDPSGGLLRNPSMHAKLTLAVAIIAIHHWVGIRARKMARGSFRQGLHWSVTVTLITCAAAAVWLVVVKPI